MSQEPPRPHYYACLLRIWREDGSDPWRASIQHPHSGERILFPDVLAAFAYIETQLHEVGRADEAP